MLESVHAILLLGGRYVLQLRDIRPDIAASGQWALFGGLIDGCEDPQAAVRREVREELGIEPKSWIPLGKEEVYAEFERQTIRMWFFEAVVDGSWDGHQLLEGRAVKDFSAEECRRLDMPAVFLRLIEQHALGAPHR